MVAAGNIFERWFLDLIQERSYQTSEEIGGTDALPSPAPATHGGGVRRQFITQDTPATTITGLRHMPPATATMRATTGGPTMAERIAARLTSRKRVPRCRAIRCRTIPEIAITPSIDLSGVNWRPTFIILAL
jgi:hypothetical protein